MAQLRYSLTVLALLACLALSGCGYSLAGRGSFLPDYIRIVGVPAFLSGHNGKVAWGSTAANVDNTDLFRVLTDAMDLCAVPAARS